MKCNANGKINFYSFEHFVWDQQAFKIWGKITKVFAGEE